MSIFFHIHTYRCGHAPFPDNPFTNRMKYEELSEYLSSLTTLKNKYQDKIEVVRGLEIEYLPSFDDYYKQLIKCKALDILALGQHHYEISLGHYSNEIIKAALDKNILLEKNYSSMKNKNHFRKEFWKNVNESMVIYGYDAHSLKDLEPLRKR